MKRMTEAEFVALSVEADIDSLMSGMGGKADIRREQLGGPSFSHALAEVGHPVLA